MPTIVAVVDTTALFTDVSMTSTSWTQLLSLSAREEILIAIPEVVLRETARHWTSEVQTAIETLQSQISRISRSKNRLTVLGVELDIVTPLPFSSIEVDQFDFLRRTKDRLSRLRVAVLPIPNIAVDDLLERDLARIKPFDSSGKGFRDALVWESVKSLLSNLQDFHTVYFVSANSADYSLSGSLHPSLTQEIENLPPTLKYVEDLKSLLSQPDLASKIVSLGTTNDELSKYLAHEVNESDFRHEEQTVGAVVVSAVISAAEYLANEEVDNGNPASSGIDFTDFAIAGNIENLTIDVVECEEDSVEWQTYETYDDTTLLVQATVLAQISLDGYAYKSDLATYEEDGIHVLEWDWNDYMSRVATSVLAKLTFQMRVEVGVGVEDVQLETVEPVV